MTDKLSRDLNERLTTARGLVASFDPAAGAERTAAFLNDLTRLFAPGTAEHAVTVALTDRYAPDPDSSIDVLAFSSRVRNTLMREGIRTVRDLTSCDRDNLYDLRNFGPGAMGEVTARLSEHGLKLRDAPGPSQPIGFQQLATSHEHIAEAVDRYRNGTLTSAEALDAIHEQVGDMPVRLGGAS